METFVDIISDIGAQISKIKRCRINQQTLCINLLVFTIINYALPIKNPPHNPANHKNRRRKHHIPPQ